VSKLTKEIYRIDDTHEVVFSQFGPSIKETTDDGAVSFHAMKKSKLVLDKLRAGEYSVDDLVEIKNSVLGEYDGQALKLKTGKYGPYVEWGENRENIRDWKRPLDELTLSDAIELIESKRQTIKSTGILRNLGGAMSLRT
jgi:topoisomerase IA-like protein